MKWFDTEITEFGINKEELISWILDPGDKRPLEDLMDCESETTEPENHELQYLTPEMIEIFRHTELFQLEKEKESVTVQELEIQLTGKELQLEKEFQLGLQRNPVMWPVY